MLAIVVKSGAGGDLAFSVFFPRGLPDFAPLVRILKTSVCLGATGVFW